MPQLTTLQLLNALVVIEREGPLGRRALSHVLQIKDGIARGLTERLADSRIVSVTETGVQLTKVGRDALHKFLRQLSILKIFPLEGSDLIRDSRAMGIHVKGGYRAGMTGVIQRDEAIKAGAEGSITVAVVGRKLVIPPDNKNLADLAAKENSRLRSELELQDKDLIMVGFGKDSGVALAGALAAVLSLKRR